MREADTGAEPVLAHGQYSFMFEQSDAAIEKNTGLVRSAAQERNAAMATHAGMTPAGIRHAGESGPQSEGPQRVPYWLQQAERFLRVIVRIYLGLLVCLAPWYPPAWEANPLFQNSPGLVHWLSYGAVRGIVSGLGLLNLWIALGDALRPLRIPASGRSQ